MSKKELKLTPWFDGDVRPVRTGYYQRAWSTLTEYPDYWNGSHWFNGDGSDHDHWPALDQSRQWRGLAVKP